MLRGIVAIVGRPNVGKSTLFNALTGTKRAIVDDQPGVTRDRLYGHVSDENGEGFTLIDTGGFEEGDGEYQPFSENLVWRQTMCAIDEADVVILLLDGREGLQLQDKDLVQYLTRANKRVLYVLNKVDDPSMDVALWEFYGVGIQEVLAISATQKRGVGRVVGRITQELRRLPNLSKTVAYDQATKVALIGRPNVGKSSILNRLLGEERALVSDIAGTTRDSLHSQLMYQQQPYVIIDTAGMRRKTRIQEKLEGLSVLRSIRAIEEADIVALVIEAETGMTDQDLRLANLAISRNKAVMIVVNKWDLVTEKNANSARDYAKELRELALRNLDFVPIHFISCLKNQRVHQLLSHIETLAQSYNKRVETARVNEVLQRLVDTHTPQLIKKYKKRVKFYFGTQVSSKPPTFVIKCNVAGEIKESYRRFLANRFRESFALQNVPIRLIFRGKTRQEGEDDLVGDSVSTL